MSGTLVSNTRYFGFGLWDSFSRGKYSVALVGFIKNPLKPIVLKFSDLTRNGAIVVSIIEMAILLLDW